MHINTKDYDWRGTAFVNCDFVPLVLFLIECGSNPNVLCSRETAALTWDNRRGTALDMFACRLRISDNYTASDESGVFLHNKLINEGAEFSRSLNTLEGIHPAFQSEYFEKEVEELQKFPEQIESTYVSWVQMLGSELTLSSLRLQQHYRCDPESFRGKASEGLEYMRCRPQDPVEWPDSAAFRHYLARSTENPHREGGGP